MKQMLGWALACAVLLAAATAWAQAPSEAAAGEAWEIEEVLGSLKPIQQTATALAHLDVLAGFAETARLHNYCQPEVQDEGVILLREGRHPV